MPRGKKLLPSHPVRMLFVICHVALCVTLLTAAFFPAAASRQSASGEERLPLLQGGAWQFLAPGLELREYRQYGGESALSVLRIDPKQCEVVLYSAALEGHASLTPRQWAGRHRLAAVINASMYLPDGMTSTAYMRRGAQTANRHIAEKYGSFFVSSPRKAGLAPACLLDRDADDWRSRLADYDVVVQNFRLIGPEYSPRWPEHGPHHSVAAVGMDAAGLIYFLHYEPPVTVHAFVRILREKSGLDLTHAMYVEGGAQAVLGLWTGKKSLYRAGRHVLPFWKGEPLLPNILGVRLKP